MTDRVHTYRIVAADTQETVETLRCTEHEVTRVLSAYRRKLQHGTVYGDVNAYDVYAACGDHVVYLE